MTLVNAAKSGRKPFTRANGERIGRAKGTPNRATTSLRDIILGSLEDVGGQKYLAKQAIANPGPYMALIAKVLPTTLANDKDSPLFGAVSTLELEQRAIARLLALGMEPARAQEIVRDRMLPAPKVIEHDENE